MNADRWDHLSTQELRDHLAANLDKVAIHGRHLLISRRNVSLAHVIGDPEWQRLNGYNQQPTSITVGSGTDGKPQVRAVEFHRYVRVESDLVLFGSGPHFEPHAARETAAALLAAAHWAETGKSAQHEAKLAQQQ